MIENLPAIYSSFNAVSFVCLIIAYRAIRNNNKDTHKKFMLAALGASAIFLALYLVYHYMHGHTEYHGTGLIKYFYFFILITHIFLAVAILPFIIKIVYHAFKQEFDKHKKWARKTLPVWIYVSITGVLIYLMLYQM